MHMSAVTKMPESFEHKLIEQADNYPHILNVSLLLNHRPVINMPVRIAGESHYHFKSCCGDLERKCSHVRGHNVRARH